MGALHDSARAWLDRASRLGLALVGGRDLFARRPPSAIPPDAIDLMYLYRQIVLRRPGTVLEFGSGCSTIVIAKALADLRRLGLPTAVFHSVEADADWLRISQDSLPGALRPYVAFHHCPAVPADDHDQPGWRHLGLPRCAPDFVYLDGPALTPERPVAVDVVDLEPYLPARFAMVVDGRRQNVEFLRRNLRGHYRVRYSPLRMSTLFTRAG